jgi:hypothetical protein
VLQFHLLEEGFLAMFLGFPSQAPGFDRLKELLALRAISDQEPGYQAFHLFIIDLLCLPFLTLGVGRGTPPGGGPHVIGLERTVATLCSLLERQTVSSLLFFEVKVTTSS